MKSGFRKIIFIAAGVAAVIVQLCTLSCSGNRGQVMAMLDRADSLMADNPRAAMEVLTAVANGKDTRLSRQERAYFLLLRTEADYWCGNSVVSDADVREAVRYFRNHGQRSLYARALLMQGAVYQDMADTVMALQSYLEARPVMEEEKDFESLALLHTVLGNFYLYVFSDRTRAVREYDSALANYARSGDVREEAHVHLAIARELLCDTVELAAVHISEGLELSRKYGDTAALLAGYGLLARQYNLQNEYGRALDCIREAMKEYGGILERQGMRELAGSMYMSQAEAYASLGLADSAKKALESAGMLSGLKDSVRHADVNLCRSIGATVPDVDSSTYEKELKIIGLVFENLELKDKADEAGKRTLAIAAVMVFLMCAAMALYVMMRGRILKLKRENAALRESIETFDISAREDRIPGSGEANAEMDAVLKDMVSLIGEMNEACSRAEDGSCENIRKMLDRYFPEKEIHDRVCRICDLMYPGVLSRIKEEHPSLTGNDLLLIALMACGFPTGAICAIRRLNVHSLNVQKTRTARKIAPGLRLSDFVSRNFPRNSFQGRCTTVESM